MLEAALKRVPSPCLHGPRCMGVQSGAGVSRLRDDISPSQAGSLLRGGFLVLRQAGPLPLDCGGISADQRLEPHLLARPYFSHYGASSSG